MMSTLQTGDGAAAVFEGQRPSFTPLPNWLRGQASALEIAVLWVLQSHYPEIRPSLSRLADESSLSRRTVQKVLADMERKGWLVRVQRISQAGDRDCNLYQLRIWEQSLATGGRAADARRAGDAPPMASGAPRGRAGDALGVGQQLHGGRAGDANEVDQENKIKRTRSRKPIEGTAPAALLFEGEGQPNGRSAATLPVTDQVPKADRPRTPPKKARDPFASKALPAGVVPADLEHCAALLAEYWSVKKGTRSQSVFNRVCNKLRLWSPTDQRLSLEDAIAGAWANIYPAKTQQAVGTRRHDPNPGPPMPYHGPIRVNPNAWIPD